MATPTSPPSARYSTDRTVTGAALWPRLICLALAIVFALSALSKAVDLGGFATIVRSYQVDFINVEPQSLAGEQRVQLTHLFEARQLTRERSEYVAFAVMMAEMLLAAAFAFRLLIKPVVVPATLLMLAGFTAAILHAWIVLGVEDCGCGGVLIEIPPPVSLVKNLVLATLCIGLLAAPMGSTLSVTETPGLVTATVGVVLLSLAAVGMVRFNVASYFRQAPNPLTAQPTTQPIAATQPTTRATTQPRDPMTPPQFEGGSFEVMPLPGDGASSGSGGAVSASPQGTLANRPTIQGFGALLTAEVDTPAGPKLVGMGETLLAVLSTDCPHCRDAVPTLNDLAALSRATVVGVTMGLPQDASAFQRETGATFDMLRVDQATFLSLFDAAPPAFMLLRDGELVQSWQQSPPDVAAVETALMN